MYYGITRARLRHQALWRAKHEVGTPLPQESVLQHWYERMKPADGFVLTGGGGGGGGGGGAGPMPSQLAAEQTTSRRPHALSPSTARNSNSSGSQSSALGADFFAMLHQRQ
jgi:hypothetical protein